MTTVKKLEYFGKKGHFPLGFQHDLGNQLAALSQGLQASLMKPEIHPVCSCTSHRAGQE